MMYDVDNVTQLARYQSLRYERLQGDKKGLSSVRVNDQYRIIFEEGFEEDRMSATICEIIELSNHYK